MEAVIKDKRLGPKDFIHELVTESQKIPFVFAIGEIEKGTHQVTSSNAQYVARKTLPDRIVSAIRQHLA